MTAQFLLCSTYTKTTGKFCNAPTNSGSDGAKTIHIALLKLYKKGLQNGAQNGINIESDRGRLWASADAAFCQI